MRALHNKFFLMGMLMAGCQHGSTTDVVIKAVTQSIPRHKLLTEFKGLFPNGDHRIAHYNMGDTSPQWTSKAGLYGRYIVKLTAKAKVDYTQHVVVALEDVKIRVIEVESIKGETATYGGLRKVISADEWQDLVKSKGDFGKLGISLRRDASLPGFEEAWKDL